MASKLTKAVKANCVARDDADFPALLAALERAERIEKAARDMREESVKLLNGCWAAFGDVLGTNRTDGPKVNRKHIEALQEKIIEYRRALDAALSEPKWPTNT